MTRKTKRWQTSLGGWVATYGVTRLSHDLSARGAPATPKAIYNWLAGSCSPRPVNAEAMVQLSGGRLSLSDVYAHRALLESNARASRAPG